MFTVHIRKNATGEVRQWVEKDADWDDGFDYIWVDGNCSCDCNRALYFARAKDEDETEAWEQDCGESAYSVPFVELPDGTRISIDET